MIKYDAVILTCRITVPSFWRLNKVACALQTQGDIRTSGDVVGTIYPFIDPDKILYPVASLRASNNRSMVYIIALHSNW